MSKKRYIRIIKGAFGDDPENRYGIVEEITEPKEGGILVKFKGCSYLYKGYPKDETLKSLRAPKVAFRIFRHILSIKIVKIVLAALFFIHRKSAEKILLRFVKICLQESYYMIEPNILEPREYCASVREIYRVMTLIMEEIESQKIREMMPMIRNTICMFLEYDNAYKFIMQDILPEIDKTKLKESPIKEINRVFEIFFCRSRRRQKRYTNLKKLIIYFLIFNKKGRKHLVKFISELNFERIKLDEADWYFSLQRSYDFRGISREDRLKIKKKIDKEKNHCNLKKLIKHGQVV